MKIVIIGDPHGNLNLMNKIPIKRANLVLITGDLGDASLMRRLAFGHRPQMSRGRSVNIGSRQLERRAFLQAYNSSVRLIKYLSKRAPVFTIFGNVESSNAETRKMSKRLKVTLPLLQNDLSKMGNVRVINNVVAHCGKLRIGGLEYFMDDNWAKEFAPTRLSVARSETRRVIKTLNRFGPVDILLCHQPPYGVLDKVTARFAPPAWRGKHAGSKSILKYIKDKQPKYVFCGHIHEGKGMQHVGKTEVYNLGCGGYKIIEV